MIERRVGRRLSSEERKRKKCEGNEWSSFDANVVLAIDMHVIVNMVLLNIDIIVLATGFKRWLLSYHLP